MSDQQPLVVLVGPPAAGKSRVGKRVSKILDVPFLDTDRVISATHGAIADIFETRGEDYFRTLERSAVVEALGTPGVVALGGGAVIDADTREDLKQHSVALITISEEAVGHRLNTTKRPLLTDGIDSWKALATLREPWYQEVATVSFDTSHQTIDQVAEQVALWIEHGGANDQ
jgi:shikimate kinase